MNSVAFRGNKVLPTRVQPRQDAPEEQQERAKLPEIIKYVRELEVALQKQKDEYSYLFNTPVLRFARGVKNLKNNRELAFRDMRMALKHWFRGRSKKYNEVLVRKFTASALRGGEQEWHPYAFLHGAVQAMVELRIGEPLSGAVGEQVVLTPANVDKILFKYPGASLKVYANTKLIGTDWGDLFSVEEMQNFKRFCWLKGSVEEYGGGVDIIVEEQIDLTLLSYLRRSN